MKKIYMKPEMDVYKMNVANIVCTSPGLGEGKATPGGGSLTKELPDFDDFDGEIDLNQLLWK
jgi:hypothetical protein